MEQRNVFDLFDFALQKSNLEMVRFVWDLFFLVEGFVRDWMMARRAFEAFLLVLRKLGFYNKKALEKSFQ